MLSVDMKDQYLLCRAYRWDWRISLLSLAVGCHISKPLLYHRDSLGATIFPILFWELVSEHSLLMS
jgi:hypothetical protein